MNDTYCDIFDPSVYAPDTSRYRASYIRSLMPNITTSVDCSQIHEYGPPKVEVESAGEAPNKHFVFKFFNLKGDKGDKGDAPIERLTLLEFGRRKSEGTLDLAMFYFVTSITDDLRFIYAGDTLIARSDSQEDIFFPFTFPLVFGS